MAKRRVNVRPYIRRKEGKRIFVRKHVKMIPVKIGQHQIDVFRQLSMRPRETGGYFDFNKKGQLERTILRFGDEKKVLIPPEDYEAEWHTHPNPKKIKEDLILKIKSPRSLEMTQKFVDEKTSRKDIKVPTTLKVRRIMRSYLPSEEDIFRFLNSKKRKAMVIFHQNDAILLRKTKNTDKLVKDIMKKHNLKTAEEFINYFGKFLGIFNSVLPLNRLVTNKPVNRDYIIQLYKNSVKPVLKKVLAVDVEFIPKEKKELFTKLEVFEPKQ